MIKTNNIAPFKLHIFCCTNKRPTGHSVGSCGEKCSEDLYLYLKARCRELGLNDVRVNATGCMSFCKFGPTMVVYPDGIWYSCKSTADIDGFIQSHLIEGKTLERLLLKPVVQ